MLRALQVGALFALAACSDGLQSFSMPDLSGVLPNGLSRTVEPVKSIALYGGAVTVRGADGYCADPSASRPDEGFAIFAPCLALGEIDAKAAIPAIMTVQVGQAGSGVVSENPDAFAAVLESDAGPQILSRSGDGKTVDVQSVAKAGDYVVVAFDDSAQSEITGVQDAQWRAFGDISDRLISVSVRGFLQAPLTDPVGKALLARATAAIDAANVPPSDQEG